MRRRLHFFGLISFKNQAICAAARPKTRKLKTQTPLKRAKTQNTKHRLRPRGPKHVKHKTQNTVKTQVRADREELFTEGMLNLLSPLGAKGSYANRGGDSAQQL